MDLVIGRMYLADGITESRACVVRERHRRVGWGFVSDQLHVWMATPVDGLPMEKKVAAPILAPDCQQFLGLLVVHGLTRFRSAEMGRIAHRETGLVRVWSGSW
ncbi:hypothetical protein [Streptomyces sp. NPDC001530]|uniref:hypothetical protein n=1 Tax=Streptomyces sp. NPDC001530 TaxID=3364582 RepID=UPI0036A2AC9D